MSSNEYESISILFPCNESIHIVNPSMTSLSSLNPGCGIKIGFPSRSTNGCFDLSWLCSEFSVNARFHDKTVHILRSSEPEAEAEPPPMAARSVLDRLA